MSDRPTISVALASYQGERFMEAQLDSILRQTLLPDEIVVSDGGSTDRTVALARGFLGAHPELGGRVIADHRRLRVTQNFERAIAATTGDLIALCDQDDLWAPDRLQRDAAAFDEPSVQLVHSDARLVGVSGAPLGIGLFAALGIGDEEIQALAGDAAFALLVRRNLVTGATAMIRRELAVRAMPFPQEWVHDEWLAILAAASGRIHPIRRELVDYRQHGGNEIGVSTPSLRGRLARMWQPRGDRLVRLAARASRLAEFLDAAEVPQRWRDLAHRKEAFELRRARYGRLRISRIVPIVRNSAHGAYVELSSQGRLDVIRDLVQPAGKLS